MSALYWTEKAERRRLRKAERFVESRRNVNPTWDGRRIVKVLQHYSGLSICSCHYGGPPRYWAEPCPLGAEAKMHRLYRRRKR